MRAATSGRDQASPRAKQTRPSDLSKDPATVISFFSDKLMKLIGQKLAFQQGTRITYTL